MVEQIIQAVDEHGAFEEYIPRSIGHTGEGRRHRAITALITNTKGELLLQKRKHRLFDNIWCFSADTHPLHMTDHDENVDQAARRALKEDFDIQGAYPLANMGDFTYFAKYGEYCENEYCAMMVGEYNGAIQLNPEAGYEYTWMTRADFLTDFATNPVKYAPWVPGGVEVLQRQGFFDI